MLTDDYLKELCAKPAFWSKDGTFQVIEFARAVESVSVAALRRHIEQVEAELTALRADAARYQWLKANALIDWEPDDGIAMVIPEPSTGRNWKADTDAAIDAAIAQERK